MLCSVVGWAERVFYRGDERLKTTSGMSESLCQVPVVIVYSDGTTKIPKERRGNLNPAFLSFLQGHTFDELVNAERLWLGEEHQR